MEALQASSSTRESGPSNPTVAPLSSHPHLHSLRLGMRFGTFVVTTRCWHRTRSLTVGQVLRNALSSLYHYTDRANRHNYYHVQVDDATARKYIADPPHGAQDEKACPLGEGHR